mgnify:CR=1 FL=1|tara:strand:+ start:1665 stop:2138 length:474 start_codon:yes stop_codon:yes gene_type:complete
MTGAGKGIIAFDPGKGGGFALLRPNGSIDPRPWTVEHEALEIIQSLDPVSYEAVIEDVPPFVAAATSSASSFKLGYNYGFIVGAVRGHGLPTHLVKPQIWQKGLVGLKPKMGYTARKRQLKDNAVRLYPDLKITNATADAVLIMNFWKKERSKWTGA